MDSPYEIAVLPGDGIGAEVTAETLRILDAVAAGVPGLILNFREVDAGAGAYLRDGDPLPESAFTACTEADAILLGAMGLPNVRWPDGREMTPQLDLRERLDLYAGLRPIYLFDSQDTPLKGYGPGEIDFLLVRENTEGLFASRKQTIRPSLDEARDTLAVTRHGSERVFRAAFRQAARRRRKVSLVDKANVLPSMVFFREIFDAVASEFPEIETEHLYVDAAALYLVQRPDTFDVLVTENMFGDILSDLAAGLVGGMGMAPSGDIGDRHAVFQPSHGTAPDIAGKGIANPVATLLSASMMLEWLGSDPAITASQRLVRAVKTALSDPACRTPDLGGALTTRAMGDCILDALGALAPSAS